jgi:hypothetical protein
MTYPVKRMLASAPGALRSPLPGAGGRPGFLLRLPRHVPFAAVELVAAQSVPPAPMRSTMH